VNPSERVFVGPKEMLARTLRTKNCANRMEDGECCGNGSAKLKCHLSQAGKRFAPLLLRLSPDSSGQATQISGGTGICRNKRNMGEYDPPDGTWRLCWRSPLLTLIIFIRPSHKFPSRLFTVPSFIPPLHKMLPSCQRSANKIINCCSALNSWPRRCCRSGSKHCHKTSTHSRHISSRPPQAPHLKIS